MSTPTRVEEGGDNVPGRPSLPELQKILEEVHKTNSTAMDHYGNGNEGEALRCWETVLQQVNDVDTVPDRPPQSDTEAGILAALEEMGLYAQEQIDLLEALRLSRLDDLGQQRDSNISIGERTEHRPSSVPARDTDSEGQGWTWARTGTVSAPVVTYRELPRPSAPSLPPRPQFLPLPRTQGGISSRTSSSPSSKNRNSPRAEAQTSRAPSYSLSKQPSRSPSPEKHTLRTTLRAVNPSEKKSTKGLRQLISRRPSGGPGASKAAALAWNTQGPQDKAGDTATPNSESSVPRVAFSALSDTPRNQGRHGVSPSPSSRLEWDSNTRRLIPRIADSSKSASNLRHSGEEGSPLRTSLSINAAASALGSSLSLSSLEQAGTSRSRRSAEGASHNDLPPPRRPASQTLRGYSSSSFEDRAAGESPRGTRAQRTSRSSARRRKPKPGSSTNAEISALLANSRLEEPESEDEEADEPENSSSPSSEWEKRKAAALKSLPAGVDKEAAEQILNEIVVQGDDVAWDDIAGLEKVKKALREAAIYPIKRPDLFAGLREPATGMLLFGPPGTGKTMLARAVAAESASTFFSISASSLTSKWLGESEKLVRALFALAKVLAPSIIFVDEIDSILSQRSGSGEQETLRRIKTEFLIQWSGLQPAAAGRDQGVNSRNRVLVLAATNLPWVIDEAARRRFSRRQYIPLPEAETRATHLRTLLKQQNHNLSDDDIQTLVKLTDGYSGSDITALAKDAAMGPLRSLGEALLSMKMEEIRPIELADFVTSLEAIRPSVNKASLQRYEEWAGQFGERG